MVDAHGDVVAFAHAPGEAVLCSRRSFLGCVACRGSRQNDQFPGTPNTRVRDWSTWMATAESIDDLDPRPPMHPLTARGSVTTKSDVTAMRLMEAGRWCGALTATGVAEYGLGFA
jgi:hypothetical protein